MSFAPEFYSFTIFRFFMGMFNMQIFLAAFVIGKMVFPSKCVIATDLVGKRNTRTCQRISHNAMMWNSQAYSKQLLQIRS